MAEIIHDRGHRYPCSATFDIHPFRFECAGHHYDREDLHAAARRRGRLIEHRSTSPGMVGDVEVTFWTEPDPEVDE